MSKFQELGYNENTLFIALIDHDGIKKGDVLKLFKDYNCSLCRFENSKGITACFYLPNCSDFAVEELAVYEPPRALGDLLTPVKVTDTGTIFSFKKDVSFKMSN